MRAFAIRRIIFVSHANYFDDSNGAAVASRAMMQSLARMGFATEVLCGTMLDLREEIEPGSWLAQRYAGVEELIGTTLHLDFSGIRWDLPPHFRLAVKGVPVTVHRSSSTRPHTPDQTEGEEFLRLYEMALKRFAPDVVVGYGGSWLAREVFARSRARGVATVFMLHNFLYPHREAFSETDRVCVPSRFAADYYRKTLGLECTVLPNLIDFARVRAETHCRQYVTFVTPSVEKGVYVFARIADELGRRRPDIPLLVVEGRGTERTLVDCSIDLRVHGNISLMTNTPDPRQFWSVTKLCLMPSLWMENQPLAAIEAMINGIPVIGSDRGGIPETLGGSGVVLPLPERLTAATRRLPSPEEVEVWVETIIRLWDDDEWYAEHERQALAESQRWTREIIEPMYVDMFINLVPAATPKVVV